MVAARVWRRDGSSKVEAARRWGQGGGKVVAKWSWRGSGDEAVVTLDGGGTVVVGWSWVCVRLNPDGFSGASLVPVAPL